MTIKQISLLSLLLITSAVKIDAMHKSTPVKLEKDYAQGTIQPSIQQVEPSDFSKNFRPRELEESKFLRLGIVGNFTLNVKPQSRHSFAQPNSNKLS